MLSSLSRESAPQVWHLPSKEEFAKLLNYVEIAVDSIILYKKLHMEALVDGIENVANHLRDFTYKDGFNTLGFSFLGGLSFHRSFDYHNFLSGEDRDFGNFWSYTSMENMIFPKKG